MGSDHWTTPFKYFPIVSVCFHMNCLDLQKSEVVNVSIAAGTRRSVFQLCVLSVCGVVAHVNN